MGESTTYKLRLAVSAKITVVAVLVVLTIAGFAIPFAEVEGNSISPSLFALLWFAVLAVFWHQILSLPQSIILHADDTLEF